MFSCSGRVRYYDAENIDDLIWPDSYDGRYAEKYIRPMIKYGVNKYISNVDTIMAVICVDDIVLPLTINSKEYNNSYVCSPYTHYITYAIEELKELRNPIVESFAKLMICGLSVVLKAGKINKNVHINNWLLSTNLYPILDQSQLSCITEYIAVRFPEHAIIFRSINEVICGTVYRYFRDNGYLMNASRSSYIFDPSEIHAKNDSRDIKNDKKLQQNSRYRWVDDKKYLNENTIRMKDLYDQLYLGKYSKYNPQFTAEFIDLAVEHGIFQLEMLADGEKADGLIGYFMRNGVMTTPFFGYDLSIPREIGLYRMLSLRLMDLSVKMSCILHASSGAGKFKKTRGAKNIIEYSAVKINHLPAFRRFTWRLLACISNKIAMPMIIRKGL